MYVQTYIPIVHYDTMSQVHKYIGVRTVDVGYAMVSPTNSSLSKFVGIKMVLIKPIYLK